MFMLRVIIHKVNDSNRPDSNSDCTGKYLEKLYCMSYSSFHLGSFTSVIFTSFQLLFRFDQLEPTGLFHTPLDKGLYFMNDLLKIVLQNDLT